MQEYVINLYNSSLGSYIYDTNQTHKARKQNLRREATVIGELKRK